MTDTDTLSLEEKAEQVVATALDIHRSFHSGTIAPEFTDGQYHENSDWGSVYTVHKTCYVYGATVDAYEASIETLTVWELEDDGDGVEFTLADDPVYERQFDLRQGVQDVRFDMRLEPGRYFFQRTSEDAGPLLRDSAAEPETINDPSVPMEWVGGWHPTYGPNRTFDLSRFYYYWMNLRVDYVGDPPTQSASGLDEDTRSLSAEPVTSNDIVDQPQPPDYGALREQWLADEITIEEFDQGVETVLAVHGWEHVENYRRDE